MEFRWYSILVLGLCLITVKGKKSATIINGEEAKIEDFPYTCQLSFLKIFQCTCVIIDKWTILTAAHCVWGTPSIYLTVTAGKENAETYVKSPYWDWFSGVVHRKVSTVAAHPAFDDSSLTNDIAILRLSRPLPKTNKIKPVDRLATPLDNVVGNHECFIAGFGAVHVEDVDGDIRSVPATTLQKANVPIIENHACTGLIEGINHSRICVFEVKGGRASCFGDSGGPLTCNIAGKWVLVGLTSYGFTTCSAPSVYTRVSSYQDWLEEHGVL